MITSYLLEVNLGISKPTYLDIGAHHPSYLSNTFHFYRRGNNGIVVEPDQRQFQAILKARPRDTCLNVGIGIGGASSAEFYVMENPVLSTFSKEEMDGYVRTGLKLVEIVQVPLMTVSEVLEQHAVKTPNFISIDTEGLDLEIIRSIDLTKYRPEVFCAETMDHERQTKTNEFKDFFAHYGYIVHSDTYLNTIFVEEAAWAKRRGLPKQVELPQSL